MTSWHSWYVSWKPLAQRGSTDNFWMPLGTVFEWCLNQKLSVISQSSLQTVWDSLELTNSPSIHQQWYRSVICPVTQLYTTSFSIIFMYLSIIIPRFFPPDFSILFQHPSTIPGIPSDWCPYRQRSVRIDHGLLALLQWEAAAQGGLRQGRGPPSCGRQNWDDGMKKMEGTSMVYGRLIIHIYGKMDEIWWKYPMVLFVGDTL